MWRADGKPPQEIPKYMPAVVSPHCCALPVHEMCFHCTSIDVCILQWRACVLLAGVRWLRCFAVFALAGTPTLAVLLHIPCVTLLFFVRSYTN